MHENEYSMSVCVAIILLSTPTHSLPPSQFQVLVPPGRFRSIPVTLQVPLGGPLLVVVVPTPPPPLRVI